MEEVKREREGWRSGGGLVVMRKLDKIERENLCAIIA